MNVRVIDTHARTHAGRDYLRKVESECVQSQGYAAPLNQT